MLRDPNNPSLVLGIGGPVPRLERRTGSTQYLTAAATIDPGAGIALIAGDSSRWARIARVVQPFDLTVSRNQLSSYDGIPIAPGLGFQFGFGGIDAFRSMEGFVASNAGASTDIVLSNTLALGGGVSLSSRAQRTLSRHWSRRLATRTTALEGDQVVYPDVSLRWSGRPRVLSGMFSVIGLTARAVRARQEWRSPSDVATLPGEGRDAHQTSFPISANLVTAWGDISLSGTYAHNRRVDSLPGSVARGQTSDLVTDVAKSLPLPSSWGTKSPLRARVSWQETLAENFVSNAAVFGARSRLTDNGRRALNINLDTDVADNMNFSLQGSRVATFDRNLDRRIVQTLISAVFQMQFFAGAGK
jgi:hypothetical protein